MPFVCSNCGQHRTSDAVCLTPLPEVSQAGQNVKCPDCGQAIIAPQPSSEREEQQTPVDATATEKKKTKPDWRIDITPGKSTPQSKIDHGAMTIAKFMAEKQLAGGVSLDSTGDTSATNIITDDKGQKYELHDLMAEGGMGAIIAARDVNLRRHIAMKVLRHPGQADKEDVLRFIEEAQITSQLEHPSIIPVHELAVDASGSVFYTMKMVKGITLQAVISGIRHGDARITSRYQLPQLLTIFQKICDAMAFAHSKQVIHRDLKPDNVMVGEFGEVQVMDWGIAKAIPRKGKVLRFQAVGKKQETAILPRPVAAKITAHKPGETHKMRTLTVDSLRENEGGNKLKTMSGAIMGTQGYMAPEQALAKHDEQDEQTDIYALGAILYTILTLHPPIESKDIKEFIYKVTHGKIINPTEHGRNNGRHATNYGHLPEGLVPKSLSSVAMKALALESKHRYRNVKELQKDIEAYQQGFATLAEKAGVWKQVSLLAKRNKPAFTALGLAAATIAVVIVAAFGRVKLSEQKALRALAQVQAEQANRQADRKSSAPAMVETAKTMIMAKNFDTALTALATAVEYDPQLADARLLITAVYFLDGKYGEALEACKAYAALRPDDAQGKRLLAMCQIAVSQGPNAAPTGEMANLLSQIGMPTLGAEFAKSASDKNKLYKDQISKAWPSGGVQLLVNDDGSLRFVVENKNAVVDLQPLQGIPLTSLNVSETRVADLSPLKGMPLRSLNLYRTKVSDLTPLAGMPLTSLKMEGTKVSDLTPLKGMPLTSLDLEKTAVSNLSPLAGMPLTSLNLSWTKVSDLTPLKGMPLTSLNLGGTAVSNFSPLAGMPLTMISFTVAVPKNGIEVLREMKSLQNIRLNTKNIPVAQFWKAYDAGEFK